MVLRGIEPEKINKGVNMRRFLLLLLCKGILGFAQNSEKKPNPGLPGLNQNYKV